MPSTTEPAFNIELANALRGKHPRWRDRIGAEQSGVIRDHPGLQPDIVIRHPGGAPVIVETEFDPAHTVEAEARDRLGLVMAETGDQVEQAIAVCLPAALRRDQGRLAEGIAGAAFRYCVLTHREEEPDDPIRWPESGWLRGGIDDLAGLIEGTALSERRLAEGMRILEDGVREAADRLRADLKDDRPDVLKKIAEALHQEDGEQTSRMAAAIVANALTVHTGIAGAYQIPTLDELRGARGQLLKSKVLKTWRYILDEINYWPIFKIASDVLLPIPNGKAQALLDRLHLVAGELDGIGVTSTQDMAGQMFGRLIVDRKFLATFYTLPASAALLAELAVSKLDVDWSDPGALTGLRIADLACGTGTLLSATYRAVAVRHRRADGDDEDIHQAMIERALIGADIMPAATHLTASMLSSAHPTITYGRTRVHTMPYGEKVSQDRGGGVAIGSLNLIARDYQGSLFSTGEHALHGKKSAVKEEIHVPRKSVDLVIMNPPFVRPTNHEAQDAPIVPSFAGFATSDDEQRLMSEALSDIYGTPEFKEIFRGLPRAGHGNAGLASNFADLAHAKLKPGGILALVLPLIAVTGKSWEKWRQLLASAYRDVTVVTIATTGQYKRAFSKDTGMGEVLILAVKRDAPLPYGDAAATAVRYVNLRARPRTIVEAAELARVIEALPADRDTLLRLGDEEVGCTIHATLAESGFTSLQEPDVAAAARSLAAGALRLPRQLEAVPLEITELGNLGDRGLVDRDISGLELKDDGTPRAPFDKVAWREGATYPMLWNHDADRERRLVVEPDKEGRVRPDCDERAVQVWETATRLHFNRDFRVNSQSLAACLTAERAIGGRAWPNFTVEGDESWEKALALWANTTLGLIVFWWTGSRQQQGRAILTISALPSLPVLDVRTLNARQIRLAEKIFEDFRDWSFLPANEAYRDETRKALDQAVLCDLLGLPESILEPLDVLRRQWCAEPTVHGGKSTRPK